MTEDPSVVTFSDDDDDGENGLHPPELQGVLNKWTNFFHGWQTRFIVLRDGTLSYYKSEQDTNFGCRGAISLFKAAIKVILFTQNLWSLILTLTWFALICRSLMNLTSAVLMCLSTIACGI
jgi:PH domain